MDIGTCFLKTKWLNVATSLNRMTVLGEHYTEEDLDFTRVIRRGQI